MRDKSAWTLLFGLVLTIGAAVVAQAPGELPQGANIPKNMHQYFLCLLERGENWKPVQMQDPLVQDHPAFVREQVEAGKFVIVGPVLDQGRIGGIAIINAASLEEVRKIVDSDKIVQSGQVNAEIHPVMLTDLSAVQSNIPQKRSLKPQCCSAGLLPALTYSPKMYRV